MNRSAPLKRRTPIARQSKRRRVRDANYPQARAEVFGRADGMCEAATDHCTGWVPLDVGHVHHIAGRGGPDPHRLTNLLWCCPRCHSHIHDHPAEAYERGWMRPRTTGDPDGREPEHL